MSKIPIDRDDTEHNPETAIFCASFATEPGQQTKHSHTVALYQDSKGKFFVIEHQPKVAPTMYEPVEDPRTWLEERFKWLDDNIGSES